MRICPDCGKSVRGNNALTLHIRKKHLNIKKFQCDHCAFASYGKYEMKSHLIHVHVPKEFKDSFPCSQCSSVLSSAMGLKVHLQHKHSGLKPFSCFCGKSYSLNETLKMHIRNVHYGERRFGKLNDLGFDKIFNFLFFSLSVLPQTLRPGRPP